MFEVGFSELLVIFVLALIVLGPEKLPRLAAQVGRWVGRARAMAKQFREQLEEEVNTVEASKWKPASAAAPPPAADTVAPETSAASGTNPDASATSTDVPHEFHSSGPPPAPEAAVYEPPAYPSPSSAEPSPAVESSPTSETASHDAAAPSQDPPARPGDVITTTHERGI